MNNFVCLKNPCNIKISDNHWLGKINPSSDPVFEEFMEVEDGLRAAGKIFLNYQRLDGLQTPTQLIGRWAPPSDNNPTSTYIANMCKHCAVGADDSVVLADPDFLAKWLSGIVHQEQGYDCCTNEQIQTAVSEALA